MTHKLYTGTLTDCHGRRFAATYLLTVEELQGMTEAGVLPEDIRPLVGMESIADTSVANIQANHAIARAKRKVKQWLRRVKAGVGV